MHPKTETRITVIKGMETITEKYTLWCNKAENGHQTIWHNQLPLSDGEMSAFLAMMQGKMGDHIVEHHVLWMT